MSERYGFSLTTFSPSGKLVQIEYALNAVAAGAPSVGIKGEKMANTFLSFLTFINYLIFYFDSNKWSCIGDWKKTKDHSERWQKYQ